MAQSKARPHFTTEFTPGKTKSIDYMFGGEIRRLKKTVTATTTTPAAPEPAPPKAPVRRLRTEVTCRPKDNQEQQWPCRGLKKVASAPKDSMEQTLFQKRTLARPAVIPADSKEQAPIRGKAMVGGRSHTTSGNILSWA